MHWYKENCKKLKWKQICDTEFDVFPTPEYEADPRDEGEEPALVSEVAGKAEVLT